MALGAILGQTPTGGVSNIEIGSYIGDGSYGQNHPTIIPTNGKAKLLMIISDNTIQTANAQNSYETWLTAEITEYRGYFQNSNWPIYVEWEETGISMRKFSLGIFIFGLDKLTDIEYNVHILERRHSLMKKPKNPDKYIGKKVRMVNGDKHKGNPNWYPKVGTVGDIVNLSWTDNSAYVNWGENSGVDKGFRSYTWYIDWESIELVDDTNPHMTDEEIWEMFKPKMEKLGINPDGNFIKYNNLNEHKNYMDVDTVQKLVATAYRSGYGCG